MTVKSWKCFDSDGRLKRLFDVWHVYAAFTRPGGAASLIKIGVTTKPLERLYQVHQGSPFPVEVALWASVGDASIVRKLEHQVHAAFLEKRTRGEWFQFDLSSASDKRLFHNTMRRLYFKYTGRVLEWNRVTHQQIVATGSIDLNDTKVRRSVVKELLA